MSLEWTFALAVGHPDIDAQHQEIFRRGARLIEALRAGAKDEVGPTVAFLSAYASTHFAGEERLMRAAGYPGLEEHARQHQAFIEEFGGMVARFDQRGATTLVALEIHNWLSDWLRRHLGETDRKMVEFLRGRA